MYEYKVLTLSVRECEDTFNQLARDGWRLATVSPDQAKGVGVVAVMEREANR